MSKDFIESIEKLIEATSVVSVQPNNDSGYGGPVSQNVHKFGCDIDKKVIGRMKGFLQSEGVTLRSFLEKVIMKELDFIEKDRNIQIPIIDPTTRLKWATGNKKSPEQKLFTIIKRFKRDLTELHTNEQKFKEYDGTGKDNGETT